MKSPANLVKQIFSTLCLTMMATTTHAISPSKLDPTQHDWHFKVTPYLWAINMDGTTQLGNTRAHIDESFGDILKHLSLAGMIWLEADKDNFGIFFNGMYSVLKDSAKDGAISLDAKSRFGLFAGGVSYRFPISMQFALSPYVGARYTVNDNSLTASAGSTAINLSDNQSWTDPIVGVRALYQFDQAWSLTVAGDVGGGTNLSTDHSYNLLGLIGYQPQSIMRNTSVYLGYRLLKQLYETGNGSSKFLWNMKIAGPLLGVEFRF